MPKSRQVFFTEENMHLYHKSKGFKNFTQFVLGCIEKIPESQAIKNTNAEVKQKRILERKIAKAEKYKDSPYYKKVLKLSKEKLEQLNENN